MTSTISAHAESAIQLLVSWELLGISDIDPKQVLREVPLEDLLVIRENILRQGDGEFLSTQMVGLEVSYRHGLLRDDWALTQSGKSVSLRYSPLKQGRSFDLDLITMGGVT